MLVDHILSLLALNKSNYVGSFTSPAIGAKEIGRKNEVGGNCYCPINFNSYGCALGFSIGY